MFKHLSLHEKIELLLGTRTSGGALPLPEAFGAALSYLHDKGGTPDDVLRKVIREKRQVEFREARILEVCDDWESFCAVILDVLESEGFIIREGMSWSLGEKAIPGKELTVLRITSGKEDRRVRVTFFGEEARRQGNAVEKFRGEIDGLISRIPELAYVSPVIRETVNQYLLACSHLLREALNGPPQGEPEASLLPEVHRPHHRGRKNPGQSEWYRNWIRLHREEWHFMSRPWSDWNAEHPDNQVPNVSYFSARNEAIRLVRNGEMERRPVESGRERFEYRYIGE